MVEEIEIAETPITIDEKIKKPIIKRKRVFVPALVATFALITGIAYFHHSSTFISTDDAFIDGHIVRIAPKVSGNIIKLYIDDNQKVNKGDLIAEIDPQDYQAKYEQAMAKLETASEKYKSASTNVNLVSITSTAAKGQANSAMGAAQASVEMANKQIIQAKANLSQVNADIESVNAEVDLAKTEFDRYQKLFKKGVVSKQDYDKASTSYKTVTAKLNAHLEKASALKSAIESAYANKDVAIKSLEQAVDKLKSSDTVTQQISISDSQRKMAQAEIKQLRAEAKQAKLALSYTKIYAPQSGSITSKGIEEGSYVQTGQSLLSIVPERRWVIANFKENQLTDIKTGQPVLIKIDAYPDKVFNGHVDSIQASTGSKTSLFPPENAVGSFVKVVQRVPVKIVFDGKIDSKFAIVPGMSVIPEVKIK